MAIITIDAPTSSGSPLATSLAAMTERHRAAAARAATQDGVLSVSDLEELGVSAPSRHYWVRQGTLTRIGPRSFVIAGAPPTWRQRVRGALVDLDGRGVTAGRAAARLHGLDGFAAMEAVELLVPRAHRRVRTPHTLRSTSFPFTTGDVVTVDGLRCLSAERTIIDAPLFGFGRAEIENAIDSAIRRRLVAESRLRAHVAARTGHRLTHHRSLVKALIDTGGESRLERDFLALLRRHRLPRPELQRVFRDDGRTIARVDAFFPGDLIVELAGHGTHSTRQQRQHDEQRRTELTLAGHRVITFTYDDVVDRPDWVAAMVARALVTTVATTS